jgi:hypothetical protein
VVALAVQVTCEECRCTLPCEAIEKRMGNQRMKRGAVVTAVRALLLEYLSAVVTDREISASLQPAIVNVGGKAMRGEVPRPARFAILERMMDALGSSYEITVPRELESLIVERFAEHLSPATIAMAS